MRTILVHQANRNRLYLLTHWNILSVIASSKRRADTKPIYGTASGVSKATHTTLHLKYKVYID